MLLKRNRQQLQNGQRTGSFSSQPGAGLLGCDPAVKKMLYERAPEGMPQNKKELRANVRPSEWIASHVDFTRMLYRFRQYVPSFIRSPIANLLVVRNWLQMTLVELGLKSKADAKFDDGAFFPGVTKENLDHFRVARQLKRRGIPITYTDKTVEFDFMGRHLVLDHANGGFSPIYERFIKHEYGLLDVAGKDVVCVGAYIGDSAIYFRLRGARRVIALEPYPYMHAIAKANVARNNIDGIDVLKAGIAGKSGEIQIDPAFISSASSLAVGFASGEKIRLYTLGELGRLAKNAVLQMNCETAEYDAFLSAASKELRAFPQIIAEYHKGYVNLAKHFEEAGFSVQLLNRIRHENTPERGPSMRGLLLATRID